MEADMIKAILFVVLIHQSGATIKGTDENGFPPKELMSITECQAAVHQKAFMPVYGDYINIVYYCEEIK